jgi:hypothetical protein
MFPIKLVLLVVDNCKVHILYKIIFSNKLDLFWTRLFCCSLFTLVCLSYLEETSLQWNRFIYRNLQVDIVL